MRRCCGRSCRRAAVSLHLHGTVVSFIFANYGCRLHMVRHHRQENVASSSEIVSACAARPQVDADQLVCSIVRAGGIVRWPKDASPVIPTINAALVDPSSPINVLVRGQRRVSRALTDNTPAVARVRIVRSPDCRCRPACRGRSAWPSTPPSARCQALRSPPCRRCRCYATISPSRQQRRRLS